MRGTEALDRLSHITPETLADHNHNLIDDGSESAKGGVRHVTGGLKPSFGP